MGAISWYKLAVYILLSAKRGAYFRKSIAIEMGGVSWYFWKVPGSGGNGGFWAPKPSFPENGDSGPCLGSGGIPKLFMDIHTDHCRTIHRQVEDLAGGRGPHELTRMICLVMCWFLAFLYTFYSEEDKRATTNMQNGLVFSLYCLLFSFRLFEIKQ